jgi:hypothetical protein
MFIRKVTKKNSNSDKVYEYYRLTHSYRVGDKNRQMVVLNLGSLDELHPSKHKFLADRIEQLLTGVNCLFSHVDDEIEQLARHFHSIIVKKGHFSLMHKNAQKPDVSNNDIEKNEKQYTEVDLNSAEEIESRDLGGEWLVNQALIRLNIDDILMSLGMTSKEIITAKALITAKMIHPSSELETERWLIENSSTLELYNETSQRATRYHLYKAAEVLYTHKALIEQKIYDTCQGFFKQRNKVIIFDLTNIHFEGLMLESDRAKFGRSKQKRSDCRLISLALTIDSLGFVRGSQFWDGNIYEPDTLKSMLEYIETQYKGDEEKPLLVFDAGLSIDENLTLVKDRFDYICVSRTIPSQYTHLSEDWTELKDNRGNNIHVTKVETENGETMLLIQSDQKKKKEESMDTKITQCFEDKLVYLKEGLMLPRRLKKISKVHESVGRLKNQFSKVSKLYDISYTEDAEKGVITDIMWKRNEEKEKPKGHYFLRFSKKELTDKEIWDGYNLTREVESSFQCLKSDLNIRPVFHQKDKYIEAHIWLGVLAYQIVNFIRQQLKDNNITYRWSTIVEKLKTQRITTTTMNVKGNKKAIIKTCTQANMDVKRIYDALKFKERPFVRKTNVVTQL